MHRQHDALITSHAPPAATRALPRETIGAYAWLAYLVATLTLAIGYGLAHAIGPAWLRSGLVFNLIGGSAVVALVIGARRNTNSSRLPWYLFAIGVALFVTSGVLSWNYERLFGTAQPFPSVADQFHLAFYPFLIGGMVLLVRERRDHRDRAPLIDSMIVTTALATLLWVYLIAPYAEQTGMSLLRRSASVAYPAMDILLLGVVARVAAGSHRREPAFQFVLAGAIVLLITDVIYGSVMLGGSGYGIGGALDAGWGIFYACLGAAALHPSMRLLSERGPVPDTRLTRQRLALLASASLTVPLVIVVRAALHQSVDLYVLVAASGIMFALVLMRLAGIVHHNEAATLRESALRRAGETLVSAPTREAVYEAALEAATRSLISPSAPRSTTPSTRTGRWSRSVPVTEHSRAAVDPSQTLPEHVHSGDAGCGWPPSSWTARRSAWRRCSCASAAGRPGGGIRAAPGPPGPGEPGDARQRGRARTAEHRVTEEGVTGDQRHA